MKLLNDRGETLIEVAFATAILATAIIISFNVANLSLRSSYQAREHTQAIRLAQLQADRLQAKRDRDISIVPPASNILGPGTGYDPCGNSSMANCYIDNSLAVSPTATDCSATMPGCRVSFALSADSNVPSRAHYVVTVRWNSPNPAIQNTTSLDVVLADKRNIQPLDCSTGTVPGC